jgi:hypothetical protein
VQEPKITDFFSFLELSSGLYLKWLPGGVARSVMGIYEKYLA